MYKRQSLNGTRHAYERVPFREAYPDFTKWVDSKGASNQKWYENFVDEKTIRYWSVSYTHLDVYKRQI